MWAFGSLLASRHCRIRLILQIPHSSYLHNLCKYVFGFLQSFVPLLVSPPARHRMMLTIAQPAKILAWLAIFCWIIKRTICFSVTWRLQDGDDLGSVLALLLLVNQHVTFFVSFFSFWSMLWPFFLILWTPALHCQKMLPVQMKKKKMSSKKICT